MQTFPDKFLLPDADGLPILESQAHTLYKLRQIAFYMEMFNTALKKQNWIDRYYIDLYAGPGKNQIDQQIYLGSPLLALTSVTPFTQYRFNEKDADRNAALQQRANASSLNSMVKTYQFDANEIVKAICEEITQRDALSKLRNKWPTCNLAVLDPFGLELEWSTVERLARIRRMDLIINFSTNGLIRNADQAVNSQQDTIVDRFFGTRAWRDKYDPSASPTVKRRGWIDFYQERLQHFGYEIKLDPDFGGAEITVKNKKNAQIYSLIFASKHPLGNTLWKGAAKDANQPRLPGIEPQ